MFYSSCQSVALVVSEKGPSPECVWGWGEVLASISFVIRLLIGCYHRERKEIVGLQFQEPKQAAHGMKSPHLKLTAPSGPLPQAGPAGL